MDIDAVRLHAAAIAWRMQTMLGESKRVANPDWRENMWREIAQVLTAHVVMLRDTSIVDDGSAVATLQLIDTIRAGNPANSDETFRQIAVFEERCHGQSGPESAGIIGIARTQFDLAATVQRLILRNLGLELASSQLVVREALINLAEDHVFTLMPVWINGAVLQPTNFAHFLSGVIAPLRRADNQLHFALQGLDRSPMGAAALAGPGFPIDRDEVSDLLGQSRPVASTFDALAATDFLVNAANAASACVIPLRLLFDEFIAWLRIDPDALRLPEALLSPPDPALPHLQLPAALQRVVQDAREVEESSALVTNHVRHLPLAPVGRAVEHAFERSANAFARASGIANAVTTLISGPIELNRAWLARNAGRGLATAGDLADFLMVEEALDPVSARNIATVTINRARLEGIESPGITPQLIDSAALMVVGRELGIEIERLGGVFAPRRFIEKRTGLGGPAPVAVRELLQQERASLHEDTAWLEATNHRISLADQNLAIRRDEVLKGAAT